MPSPTVDIHNHGLPRAFLEALRRGEGERYGIRLTSDAKGEMLVRPDGAFTPIQPKRFDYPAQLAELGGAGIETIVLSVLPYVAFAACDERTAVWACRAVNDGLAEVQREFPGRMYGMGMVPLPYGKAAAAELARSSRELGLRAALIITNISGRNLDDPEFLPFFEQAEALQTLVLIHPDSRGGLGRLGTTT